jgi:hypothetical protein
MDYTALRPRIPSRSYSPQWRPGIRYVLPWQSKLLPTTSQNKGQLLMRASQSCLPRNPTVHYSDHNIPSLGRVEAEQNRRTHTLISNPRRPPGPTQRKVLHSHWRDVRFEFQLSYDFRRFPLSLKEFSRLCPIYFSGLCRIAIPVLQ